MAQTGVTKETQITLQVTKLHNQLSDLELGIDDAEQRFSSVLTSIPPACDNEKATVSLVGLAQILNDANIKLGLLNNRLREFIKRCEL